MVALLYRTQQLTSRKNRVLYTVVLALYSSNSIPRATKVCNEYFVKYRSDPVASSTVGLVATVEEPSPVSDTYFDLKSATPTVIETPPVSAALTILLNKTRTCLAS